MSEKLKPCPFCSETSAENIITRGMNGRYFINHFDGVYNIKSSIGFDTESEAIEAWNRRATMTNCKECIREIVCKYNDDVNEYCKGNCPHFKDHSKFVELPCKVGDTVYYITGLSRKYVKSAIVNEIVINSKGISELFVSNDTVNFENPFDVFYLTREEAEKALEGQG